MYLVYKCPISQNPIISLIAILAETHVYIHTNKKPQIYIHTANALARLK